ncbi:MAG TPA: Uma2 family endonuclease [Egibacteraceae bacterium]|nr:Uma2 family endonuclease [Actinomycetota bacterium]HWB73271.1 Uma2 family endonuclease [Egibacteraceae bacterium]
MGSAGTTGLTYEELQAIPDDHFRRELVDGELIVPPAPGRRHQRVVVRLAAALWAWVDEHGGEVLTAPV